MALFGSLDDVLLCVRHCLVSVGPLEVKGPILLSWRARMVRNPPVIRPPWNDGPNCCQSALEKPHLLYTESTSRLEHRYSLDYLLAAARSSEGTVPNTSITFFGTN